MAWAERCLSFNEGNAKAWNQGWMTLDKLHAFLISTQSNLRGTPRIIFFMPTSGAASGTAGLCLSPPRPHPAVPCCDGRKKTNEKMTKKQKLVYQSPQTEVVWMETVSPVAYSGSGTGDEEEQANRRGTIFDADANAGEEGSYKRSLW